MSRPPTGNPITQTSHGTTKAVDNSARPDPTVYAQEDAVVDSYQRRGSGKLDAGNCLRLRGASGLWQDAHLERSLVSTGQRVVAGQAVAIMGYTGYTIPSGAGGRHLHSWLQKPNGQYVYPPSAYTEPFGGKPPVVVPPPNHRYAGLIGKTIKFTDYFSCYTRNTDIKKPNKLLGAYVVRGVSNRNNRVVVNSNANRGLVDVPLATPAGAEYSGWKVV